MYRDSREVGIGNLSIYIPPPMIEVDALIRERILANPRMNRHLQRAVRVTGQEAIRFPEPWQDPATLAAQATHDLVTANPRMDTGRLRHLAVGTESALDHSKPISSMVQGMLSASGLPLPTRMSSFQAQHACAGGTVALLSVSALLATGGRDRDAGIVVNADVARYERLSTAEVTQGAGAVSILLEKDPGLVALDLASVGYSSRDTDDFFRPVGSIVPRVQGSYSMKCYEEALEEAFCDHCERLGQSPARVLEETGLFVLHTPFRSMPVTAMVGLVRRHLDLNETEAAWFLATRGFPDGVEPMARIGNIYTGSMWAVLAFQLRERYGALGGALVGRRIIFASYGSGNTMMAFSGRVAPGAPAVIGGWDLDRIFRTARPVGLEEYEAWMERDPYATRAVSPGGEKPALFSFAGLRDDGYRRYAVSGRLPDESTTETTVETPAREAVMAG